MNATDFSSDTDRRWTRDARGAQPWEHVDVPVVDPDGWFLREVEAGIREVERVRRATDAAMALLVAAMPQNRDTAAALTRNTGASNCESRTRQNIAKVVTQVPGALELLQAGKVSAEHLAALAPIADKPGAQQLLAEATNKSPEMLAREAQQFKLSLECGNDVVKRQHAQRFVRLTDGPDGIITITGLLPPREGTNLKTKLAALVNARYKAKHRDRAESAGGHAEDSRDQRTADALLELCGVRSYSKPPLHNGSNGSDQAHTTFNDDSNPDPGRRANHEHQIPFGSGVTDDGVTDRFFGDDQPGQPDPESGPIVAADRDATFHGADVPCTCDCEFHIDIGPDLSPGIDVRTAKPAHIIVFNVNAWEARLAGGPPVPITGDLFDQVANDLYLCFIGMESEPLKFGRARRYPTAIQTLAVIARDQQCVYPGCHNPPQHCDIHHPEEVGLDHGPTDVDALGLLCTPHHQHLHDNSQVISRNSDGTHNVRDRDTGRVIAHG